MGILSPQTCWEGTAVTSLLLPLFPRVPSSTSSLCLITRTRCRLLPCATRSTRLVSELNPAAAMGLRKLIIFPRKISVPENEQLKHSHPILKSFHVCSGALIDTTPRWDAIIRLDCDAYNQWEYCVTMHL